MSASHVIQLKFQLQSIKKGDLTMSYYLQNIKNVCDNHAAAGAPVSDTDLIVHILNGLPSEYDSFATSIRVRDTLVNPDQPYGLILTEELTLENKRKSQAIFLVHSSSTTLYAQSHSSQNSYRGKGRGRSNYTRGYGYSSRTGRQDSRQKYSRSNN